MVCVCACVCVWCAYPCTVVIRTFTPRLTLSTPKRLQFTESLLYQAAQTLCSQSFAHPTHPHTPVDMLTRWMMASCVSGLQTSRHSNTKSASGGRSLICQLQFPAVQCNNRELSGAAIPSLNKNKRLWVLWPEAQKIPFCCFKDQVKASSTQKFLHAMRCLLPLTELHCGNEFRCTQQMKRDAPEKSQMSSCTMECLGTSTDDLYTA